MKLCDSGYVSMGDALVFKIDLNGGFYSSLFSERIWITWFHMFPEIFDLHTTVGWERGIVFNLALTRTASTVMSSIWKVHKDCCRSCLIFPSLFVILVVRPMESWNCRKTPTSRWIPAIFTTSFLYRPVGLWVHILCKHEISALEKSSLCLIRSCWSWEMDFLLYPIVQNRSTVLIL